MSGETRWSWYYTSWILLASLLLARVTAVMLRLVPSQRKRSLLATSLAWVCLLVVAAAWVKVSFLGMYRRPVSVQPALYDQVAKTKGLHTAFSFDKPGYIAYYSSIRVITLDNLMGSMAFERELVSEGVNSYASNRGVDTFIGPPVPLDWAGYNSFCQKLYLDSVLFHCAQINSEEWMPVSVDVYSRIPHAYVGTLQLDPKQLLWTMKEQVSFWRIVPTDRQAQPGP
jgi:hypothetical protein